MYTPIKIMIRTLKVTVIKVKIKYLTKKVLHFRMNCVHPIFVKVEGVD